MKLSLLSYRGVEAPPVLAETGQHAAQLLIDATTTHPYAVLAPVALIGAALVVAGTRRPADELVERTLAEAEAAWGGEKR